MGRQPSKKQSKKQKARERRNHKNRSVLSAKRNVRWADKRIRMAIPFPEFRIDTSESTEDVGELVRAGVAKLESVYPQTISEDALAMMSIHVATGWTDMINEQAAHINDLTREQIERSLIRLFEKEFGDWILRWAPKNLVRRALPASSFVLKPGEHYWEVRCRSLQSFKTNHGQLYQSPHQPEVVWKDKARKIAFTHHSLNQLADRILPSWKDHYIGQAYVFGFLYECVYFDVISLKSGQPALVVYNSCLRAGAHIREFMRGLLKLKSDKEMAKHYYKVGYCPLVFDDDLAVVKTFLTPGYWHTPERGSATTSNGAKLSLVRDIEMACDDGINIMRVLTCERTREAIKWFHNHGLPQAKRIDQRVFKDMAGPYSFLGAIIDDLPIPEPS